MDVKHLNPNELSFSGFISRESSLIALKHTTLKEMPVCACNVHNAYLQVSSSKKKYVVCGLEFSLKNVGKHTMIVRALYGGKSDGTDYWRHVRSDMEEMGFSLCKAEPDVWPLASIKV